MNSAYPGSVDLPIKKLKLIPHDGEKMKNGLRTSYLEKWLPVSLEKESGGYRLRVTGTRKIPPLTKEERLPCIAHMEQINADPSSGKPLNSSNHDYSSTTDTRVPSTLTPRELLSGLSQAEYLDLSVQFINLNIVYSLTLAKHIEVHKSFFVVKNFVIVKLPKSPNIIVRLQFHLSALPSNRPYLFPFPCQRISC
jgi:hypothetical protein